MLALFGRVIRGLRVRIRISRSSFLNFLFLATVLPFFGHFRLVGRTDQA